jgi:hypothetical protein
MLDFIVTNSSDKFSYKRKPFRTSKVVLSPHTTINILHFRPNGPVFVEISEILRLIDDWVDLAKHHQIISQDRVISAIKENLNTINKLFARDVSP